MQTSFIRFILSVHQESGSFEQIGNRIGLSASQCRRLKIELQQHLGVIIEQYEGRLRIVEYGAINKGWLDRQIKKGVKLDEFY